MKTRAVILFLASITILATPALRADGKFFVRDQVPAGEPYQRAVLVHADGKEALLIQPQLVGEAKDFAWVVPVPAAPEMGILDRREADILFIQLALGSRPEVVLCSTYVIPAILIVAFLFFVISPWPRWRLVTKAAVFGILVLATGFMVPTLMKARGGPSDGVDVLQSERLGMYDVAVLRSEDPNAMAAWLGEHGFRVGPADAPVLRSYAERGWCFVTARISAPDEEAKSGLIDALVLSFAAPEPIYPFALTGSGGAETDVLLYVLADRKVSHGALPILFAGIRERIWPDSWGPSGEDAEYPRAAIQWSPSTTAKPVLPRGPKFLTKLRGRLSAKNVEGDVVLRPAAEDAPYRETVWKW